MNLSDGNKVVGLADAEWMLSDAYFAEDSSEPFGAADYLKSMPFLRKHGWVDAVDVLRTYLKK